jgi:hypothetical protein
MGLKCPSIFTRTLEMLRDALEALPRERAGPGSRISLSNPLNQPGAFDCRWIVGATSGAAVVPNPYRLQAGNADDTTTFENYPMFHTASLERPPRDGNGRFGAGNEPSLSAVWLLPAQAIRKNGQPMSTGPCVLGIRCKCHLSNCPISPRGFLPLVLLPWHR